MKIAGFEIVSGPNAEFWFYLFVCTFLFGWKGIVGFLVVCLAMGLFVWGLWQYQQKVLRDYYRTQEECSRNSVE